MSIKKFRKSHVNIFMATIVLFAFSSFVFTGCYPKTAANPGIKYPVSKYKQIDKNALAQSESQLAKGIDAYEDGNFQEAIEELEKVIEVLSGVETDNENVKERLWDAHFILGQSYYLYAEPNPEGAIKKAINEFKKAFTILREKSLDSEKYSPKIVKLYNDAVKDVELEENKRNIKELERERDEIRNAGLEGKKMISEKERLLNKKIAVLNKKIKSDGPTPWYKKWYWWAVTVALVGGAAAAGGGGGDSGSGDSGTGSADISW